MNSIGLFGHLAQGGTIDNIDLAGFGDRLLPGHGQILKAAWECFGSEDPAPARKSAEALTKLIARKDLKTGPLEGLFFGSHERYLIDLQLQLDYWAKVWTLKQVLDNNGTLLPSAKATVEALCAWNARHNFSDRYHDVFYSSRVHPFLKEVFFQLPGEDANQVVTNLEGFTKLPRHGILTRTLHHMRKAVGLE